jgi:hypothetical protein
MSYPDRRLGEVRPRSAMLRYGWMVFAVAISATASGAAPEKPGPKPDLKAEVKAPSVGDPEAAGKIELLVQEMVAGIKTRSIQSEFMRFRSYLAMKLDTTAGRYTGSEVTGNCRLRWYDHLLRNPLTAGTEAEKFTHALHQNVLDGQRGLVSVLLTAREKLDLPAREVRLPKASNTEEALAAIEQALIDAQADIAAALAPLTKSEIRELASYLYPTLVSQNRVGHTLSDRTTGRRLCDLMESMDRDALHRAAEDLGALGSRPLLSLLSALPDTGDVRADGIEGRVLRVIRTPAGAIVIGGRGRNVYHLDQLTAVAAVIDLGGDDEYREGAVSISRPVLLLVDLKGNDAYRASQPGVQGSAMLGASMLVDLEGDDLYQAQDVAQGSGLGGIGILLDFAGDDVYQGLRRVQGQALGGLGLLVDYAGNDDYRGAMWTQGFGGPLGFGLLDDVAGKDHYYTGGLYPDSYPETPGLEGWGQGVGAGLRQAGCGGLGVLLEGAGDDVYEFDYLSHGGGYWCGVGFLRDFGGNDQHLGSTNKSYSGGQRTEPEYQRFGNGWGCHYAVGFLFDDRGNDVYRGRIMGVGFGWDCAVGYLCDFAGDDRYEATGSTTQGNGAQASLGVLFDYDGDDVYVGYGQGYASPSISYHNLPGCGGNFSFVVDYGGEDNYGCGAQNNSYNQRGAGGGFLIDRPRNTEATADGSAEQPATPNVAGN